MKQRKYSSLGLDIHLAVPSFVEEFNELAKSKDPQANPCLDEATNNIVYRGSLAEFREVFLHGRAEEKDAQGNVTASKIDGVEQVTGIARKTVPVLDKDDKPVLKDGVAQETWDKEDSEAKYFKRVCAEKGVEPSSFQALAQTVADSIVFDPSATERKPSAPKNLPKDILEKATAKVGQGEEAFNKVAKLIAKDLASEQVAWTGDATKDADSLGWAIKAHIAWKAKQALEKY